MLRSRVIPFLLMHKKGLVKTVGFKSPKYVGDPINAVKIFNEKEVDELTVLDIDASVSKYDPDYSLISKLAAESRMPICYGGGVRTVDQARKIVSLGVEKISLSTAAIENPQLVTDISIAIGVQSVVITLDVKKNLWGKYDVYVGNGKQKITKSLDSLLVDLEARGAGEFVINSIDQDGRMKGYDLKLAERVRKVVDCPLTILGGAGNEDDVIDLVNKFGVIGAAAGSLFVFKGVYKAVLINYLSEDGKEQIRQIAKSL